MSDHPDRRHRGVAIVGATATGKSAVALAAARRHGAEIVSVDSMQFYRGLDIATAKPTPAERSLVPHHLIDLADPSEEFSVAEYQVELARVRADLMDREVLPVYAGGTGLYLRAVIDGLDLPGSWPEIRAELEHRVDREGPEVLYRELAERDPEASSKMEPTNARRIVRALEVVLGSGRCFSSFGGGLDTYPDSPVLQIGLRWDRETLRRRIASRVDDMLDRGLLDEVRELIATNRELSRTASHAVGYREVIGHLRGEMTWAVCRDSIILRTQQLAARQDRWFRRDPRIRWVEVQQDPVVEAEAVVEEAMESCR